MNAPGRGIERTARFLGAEIGRIIGPGYFTAMRDSTSDRDKLLSLVRTAWIIGHPIKFHTPTLQNSGASYRQRAL